MAQRYQPEDLLAFAADLFGAAGIPRERCWVMAEMLLEADLMGHDSHGLKLAPQYLADLESGAMAADGEAKIVNDLGATMLWDGNGLSGVWLTWAAIKEACERVPQYGTVTVVIRRCHRIGCLAAYLPLATQKQYMIMLTSSDPSAAPNPLAVGIPTGDEPMLIDISASAATIGLALMIEALTGGLGGYGRADGPEKRGGAVYLQIIDPNGFGGADEFARQTGWLADARRDAAGPGGGGLPGACARARKRAALKDGVELFPAIMPALTAWAEKLGVSVPGTIG